MQCLRKQTEIGLSVVLNVKIRFPDPPSLEKGVFVHSPLLSLPTRWNRVHSGEPSWLINDLTQGNDAGLG